MRHKRVFVAHYGGPDVITVIEEDIPIPKAGEVRVKVLAAGVSLPDVLAREGVHPETPRVPYTPGWDLVGTVDQLGEGMTGFELRQTVAAMPIHGCYAQYVCVPQRMLVPVPAGLDAAEAVAVVLNYITAYQMLHRSAKGQPGQRMLIHGASGGVGSAMLELAKLAGVEMYGTCSAQGAAVVRELGGIAIDYKNADFVKEIHRLTGDGVDAVFDGIGGDNLWRSRDALREGGCVVTYGFQSKMRGGRMASGRVGRHPFRESAELGWFIVRNRFKSGRKRMVPYSIQWLMRFKPAWFRHDLLTLLDLLKEGNETTPVEFIMKETAVPAKRKGKRKVAVAAKRKRAKRPETTGRPTPGREHQRSEVGSDSRIEEALRAWRLAEARRRGVPAFRILSDQVLRAIAIRRPETARELLAIPGIGITTVEKYARQFYRILQKSGVEMLPPRP